MSVTRDRTKRNAAALAWYHANKERIKAQRRARYAERAEIHRKNDRDRRANNREHFAALGSARYEANREAKLARNTAWREKNRPRVRENARRRDALKAKTKIGPVDYTRVLTESGGKCGICGMGVNVADPASFHFDHIVPLARGGTHTQDNMQLAHPQCNLRKWAKTAVPYLPRELMGAPGGMLQ